MNTLNLLYIVCTSQTETTMDGFRGYYIVHEVANDSDNFKKIVQLTHMQGYLF